MNSFKKIVSLMLALMVVLGCVSAVSAAPVAEATIDPNAKGSLTLYKYDLTNAEKDKVWDSSYVSTGVYDENVNQQLGKDRHGAENNDSDLGNGEVSYGYAIRGVEFTYVRIADIVQFTESAADGITGNHVEVLYGISKDKGADFLKAIGLTNGANRYKNAENSGKLDQSKYYYQSDVLINALAASLEANSTTVKNALENYVLSNNGISMPKTDAYGKTEAKNLDLGLYLMVETEVPEMVTCTTDPFLVSVPMTSVNGTNASDGGTRWIYDITLYPKNLTGIPSLEKTLRENIDDTGKNGGSTSNIADGYTHTGTASAGDVIDYQIISTLPSITSETTYLTTYSFVDNLSAGLSYNKGDVVLEFFSDDACTKKIATWKEADKKFTVSYNTTAGGASVMTIDMTAAGLKEINTARTVYTSGDMVNTKYQSQVHTAYEEAISEADNSVLIQARVDAEKYNQALSSGLVDAFSQAALHNAAAEYHNLLNVNNDSIMGYVNIPKINVQLPIFHGTESEVLDRGVGHVLGSSLPVGGSSTHTVLSAHSGMASQRMFTDLEQLEIGDPQKEESILNTEKRMAGDYEVIHAIHIGDREIVIGDNPKAPPNERFMCALGERNDFFCRFDNVLTSDDYTEIMSIFGVRITAQAEKTRQELSAPIIEGIDVTPICKEDCMFLQKSRKAMTGRSPSESHLP